MDFKRERTGRYFRRWRQTDDVSAILAQMWVLDQFENLFVPLDYLSGFPGRLATEYSGSRGRSTEKVSNQAFRFAIVFDTSILLLKVGHIADRLVQRPLSPIERESVNELRHWSKVSLSVIKRYPNRILSKPDNVRAPIACQVDWEPEMLLH